MNKLLTKDAGLIDGWTDWWIWWWWVDLRMDDWMDGWMGGFIYDSYDTWMMNEWISWSRMDDWMKRLAFLNQCPHVCSLFYLSVQQLAVDDVVSRCATVLGEWVIYGVVRKKQNKGKKSSPFWRNLQTQVAAVGVNAADSRGDTGVQAGAACSRTSSHLTSLKKEPVANPRTALCAAAQHVQKNATGWGGEL